MLGALVGAIVLIAALAPSAAFAAPVVAGASNVTLSAGSPGEISASTKGMTISAAPSNCFSTMASHTDILHVDKTVSSETERGSKMRFEVHAQNAGSCTITFHSGSDSATVHVTVTR
jgi:hypothetical protein